MNANLPTTPGQYWFKEEGTEDWQPYYVTTLGGAGLICHCAEDNITSRRLVSEMPSGQWVKAHSPDDGVEAWAVFNQTTSEMVVSWEDEKETQTMCNNLNQMSIKHKYTCEPVTIYRKEKE